jgi:DNA-binding transcriptional regulator/RsmH inhibitor MraZ
MQAIELETRIDKDGHISLPKKFRHAFGKSARLVVLLPEQGESGLQRRRPGTAKGVLQILAEDNEHLKDFRESLP